MGRKCLDKSGRQVQVSLSIPPALKAYYDKNGKSKLVSRLLAEHKEKAESDA